MSVIVRENRYKLFWVTIHILGPDELVVYRLEQEAFN